MIGWLILATGAALVAVVIYARWIDRRARRPRAVQAHHGHTRMVGKQ